MGLHPPLHIRVVSFVSVPPLDKYGTRPSSRWIQTQGRSPHVSRKCQKYLRPCRHSSQQGHLRRPATNNKNNIYTPPCSNYRKGSFESPLTKVDKFTLLIYIYIYIYIFCYQNQKAKPTVCEYKISDIHEDYMGLVWNGLRLFCRFSQPTRQQTNRLMFCTWSKVRTEMINF